MNNNYKCNKCNKEYYIPTTVSKFVDGEFKTFNKLTNKLLVCETCNEELSPIQRWDNTEIPFCKKAMIDKRFEKPRFSKTFNPN